jgi:hypothetical protein
LAELLAAGMNPNVGGGDHAEERILTFLYAR